MCARKAAAAHCFGSPPATIRHCFAGDHYCLFTCMPSTALVSNPPDASIPLYKVVRSQNLPISSWVQVLLHYYARNLTTCLEQSLGAMLRPWTTDASSGKMTCPFYEDTNKILISCTTTEPKNVMDPTGVLLPHLEHEESLENKHKEASEELSPGH